jgi:Uma2 family endonuclease
MATKHIPSSKARPALASQKKTTTKGTARAGETKSKTKAMTVPKTKLRKSAEASDKKIKTSAQAEAPDKKPKTTAQDAAKTSTKAATGSARGKPVKALASKIKSSRRVVEQAARSNASRRRSAPSHENKARQHEANGRVAGHAAATGVSEPPNQTPEEASATAGTQPKPGQTARADRVIQCLFEALEAHAKSQSLGHVVQEARFDWGETSKREICPDLAFVSFYRWAPYRHVPKDLTWHVVPDLVVEIVRESEQTEPISTRLDHYFHAGVNRVWVIYPRELKVYDHDSLVSSRIIDRSETLDGGTILPGFQMALQALIGEDG